MTLGGAQSLTLSLGAGASCMDGLSKHGVRTCQPLIPSYRVRDSALTGQQHINCLAVLLCSLTDRIQAIWRIKIGKVPLDTQPSFIAPHNPKERRPECLTLIHPIPYTFDGDTTVPINVHLT
ncbi:hypothetical protein CONLIGDRAFT_168325 [Coniochaeta ligniaria NRRL 30616]|uniref:Uncharacterized protein n=1 Tax=Coniochaeta ligniaria NRRL 30616 TaxID=1408157 RepID=A0A1J7JIU7_9PEZI|nr:hypothetical protein CONLIGDRAFT_168325 [Coniochaeta ligniaria NRRL 30616]